MVQSPVDPTVKSAKLFFASLRLHTVSTPAVRFYLITAPIFRFRSFAPTPPRWTSRSFTWGPHQQLHPLLLRAFLQPVCSSASVLYPLSYSKQKPAHPFIQLLFHLSDLWQSKLHHTFYWKVSAIICPILQLSSRFLYDILPLFSLVIVQYLPISYFITFSLTLLFLTL